MLAQLGWVVSRTIPLEHLSGLISGAYTAHGGVLRDGAGRIVSHLVSNGSANALSNLVPGVGMLSGLAANGQLYKLGRDMQAVQSSIGNVLNIASAGAALSGLGFVTSLVGFIYMNNRLSAIDRQLTKILDEIKDLKNTLIYQQYASLRAAVDFMKHAELSDSADTRRNKLSLANERFTELRYFYANQWRGANDIKQLPFLEDCYVLAFTGAAMTNSNIGLFDVAANEFNEHYLAWSDTARLHIKKHLLSDDPRRLFNGVSAEVLPTRELVGLLDFANGTDKGMAWVDELRKIPKSIDFQLLGVKPTILKMATNLTARNGALGATSEHLKYLESKRLSVTEFALATEEERKKLDAPAVCISALPEAA